MRAGPGVLDVHDGKSRYGLRGKNTDRRGGRENGEKDGTVWRRANPRIEVLYRTVPLLETLPFRCSWKVAWPGDCALITLGLFGKHREANQLLRSYHYHRTP
jgi:hypothetical protein